MVKKPDSNQPTQYPKSLLAKLDTAARVLSKIFEIEIDAIKGRLMGSLTSQTKGNPWYRVEEARNQVTRDATDALVQETVTKTAAALGVEVGVVQEKLSENFRKVIALAILHKRSAKNAVQEASSHTLAHPQNLQVEHIAIPQTVPNILGGHTAKGGRRVIRGQKSIGG